MNQREKIIGVWLKISEKNYIVYIFKYDNLYYIKWAEKHYECSWQLKDLIRKLQILGYTRHYCPKSVTFDSEFDFNG